MAAVLACGPGAVLSHISAGELGNAAHGPPAFPGGVPSSRRHSRHRTVKSAASSRNPGPPVAHPRPRRIDPSSRHPGDDRIPDARRPATYSSSAAVRCCAAPGRIPRPAARSRAGSGPHAQRTRGPLPQALSSPPPSPARGERPHWSLHSRLSMAGSPLGRRARRSSGPRLASSVRGGPGAGRVSDPARLRCGSFHLASGDPESGGCAATLRQVLHTGANFDGKA